MQSRNLDRIYKDHLSGFDDWNQKSHAENYILYPKNLGRYMSLDETSLSNGELYTILTNKKAKGGKGAIAAMIKGTRSEESIQKLLTIDLDRRKIVKEVTVDMANNLNFVAIRCFPKAEIVTDRFHVQQLISEVVQQQRVKYRWESIDLENEQIEKAKRVNLKYIPEVFTNGDTRRRLLARSRHLLFKPRTKWLDSQIERAEILFQEYPELEKIYEISQDFRKIYENTTNKDKAYIMILKWIYKVTNLDNNIFNTACRSIMNHMDKILNYFDNRNTNASAESFNAKLKAFRSQFRGVKDIKFFLFRVCKIYA